MINTIIRKACSLSYFARLQLAVHQYKILDFCHVHFWGGCFWDTYAWLIKIRYANRIKVGTQIFHRHNPRKRLILHFVQPKFDFAVGFPFQFQEWNHQLKYLILHFSKISGNPSFTRSQNKTMGSIHLKFWQLPSTIMIYTKINFSCGVGAIVVQG